MRDGIQNLAYSLGQNGCYALCLIDVAEEYLNEGLDVLLAVIQGIKSGFIRYNWDNWADPDNFYVNDPAGFLKMLTLKKWRVVHDAAGRRPSKSGEYVVRRYELVITGRTSSHFERDRFKPYANCKTVRLGKEVSTRVCTVE